MFKRIWSLLSAPSSANSFREQQDGSTSNDDDDEDASNTPQRKRQKREHLLVGASEHHQQSSPASVMTPMDQFHFKQKQQQQRDGRHSSYPQSSLIHSKKKREQRRNRNNRKHQDRHHSYSSRSHHYGYTDCEAEWEIDDDDDSSTDGKQRDGRRKYNKGSSSESDSDDDYDHGSTREEPKKKKKKKSVGNWKRQNAAFYLQQRKQMDSYNKATAAAAAVECDDSESESESEHESKLIKRPPVANHNPTHNAVTTTTVHWSPAAKPIGRNKVQVNDTTSLLRLNTNNSDARTGKVVGGWNDNKDTGIVVVERGTSIGLLSQENKLSTTTRTKPNKPSRRNKMKNTKMKTRSDRKKEEIENLPVATRIRSRRLEPSQPPAEPSPAPSLLEPTNNRKDQHHCSPSNKKKVVRKPAPEPNRKPEPRQPQKSLSTPASLPISKSIISAKRVDQKTTKRPATQIASSCSKVARKPAPEPKQSPEPEHPQKSLPTPTSLPTSYPFKSIMSANKRVDQMTTKLPAIQIASSCSKVARKPAPEPNRKPEPQQPQKLLSTPTTLSFSYPFKSIISANKRVDQKTTKPEAKEIASACSKVARKPAPEPKQSPQPQSQQQQQQTSDSTPSSAPPCRFKTIRARPPANPERSEGGKGSKVYCVEFAANQPSGGLPLS